MIRRTALALIAIVVISAGPILAQDAALSRLYEAMRITTSVEILRDEGLAYALDSDTAILGHKGGPDWVEAMERVYDARALERIVRDGLDKAMQNVDPTALTAFFESDLGRRVIELEISARRAFLAEGVEEAARATYRENPSRGVHADAIARFIAVNELVERNVTGALNANYLFLRALMATDQDMSEEQILADVWAEEATIRADTQEWMSAFLTLAYQPLSAEDMARYLALWETPEGHALNNAVFVGFDRMFEIVSEAIGVAAAKFQTEQDL